MLWGQQIGGILFSGYSLDKLTRAAYSHPYIHTWKLKRQKFLSNPILAEFLAIQFFFVHFTWYMFYSIKYANQRRNKNDMDDNNCQPRVFSPPYHLQLFLALSSLLLLCSSPGPELRLDFQELQN